MWGPSEWYLTGALKDWDITSRLGEIHLPTLVIGGRYDEATPAITEAVHRGILGSEWLIFENSGHFPHIEETERYLQVVDHFLDRVEAKI
jgi:proline-specific peptidase